MRYIRADIDKKTTPQSISNISIQIIDKIMTRVFHSIKLSYFYFEFRMKYNANFHLNFQ